MDMMKSGLDYGDDWEVFRANAISNFTDRINKTGQLTKIDDSIILFTYTPLPDGAHMHSFMDITDTYKVEQAIMEKNEMLKTSQNLRFELVSGISIELREPLNSVIGFAELLLNQYFGSLNQKQLEYCKYILSSSNQLNELIGNLMEMVSIDLEEEKLNISSFPLKETLEEVISSISKRAQEKNIDIMRTYDKDNIIYNGDRIRIKQAIFNVLINAIQFSSPNGKVNLRLTTDAQNIKIIITDNGEKYRDPSPSRRVFQRSNSKSVNFINSDANNISMPLVRSLLEMQGGSLHTAFNDTERCTSVICSLPLCNASMGTPDTDLSLEMLDKVVNS
jgi:K+-sensing histidine kinase KdpD